jgi:hypothetical protein
MKYSGFSGGLMLSSQISQKTTQKSGKKNSIPTKDIRTEILLSQEFSKLRNSIRSVSKKSKFSQQRTQFCRNSTGKKFQSFRKQINICISPKKSYNNESKVIRSKSFHQIQRPLYRVTGFSTNRSKKIASKIYKEKHFRLIIKLRSLALYCQFLNKTPNQIIQKKKTLSKKFNMSKVKWFFLSIQKGLKNEVKSLLRADESLIFQQDKVYFNLEPENLFALFSGVHEARTT